MKTRKRKNPGETPIEALAPRNENDPLAPAAPEEHVLRENVQVCSTDSRGYATPGNRSRDELVLDASEGFIPLWAEGVNLRWRFNESSLTYFRDPSAAKGALWRLLSEAMLAWGDAAPIRFSERTDAWDFEITMRPSDNCTLNGCTLARAFFPDGGRHELVIYPKMLVQDRNEQVDTLIHEIGHIFGLRHFFAEVTETAWPSVRFGKHKAFSIMNYGELSELTADDKADLALLYREVWAGRLTSVNGTPIVQVNPYHQLLLSQRSVSHQQS